MTFLDIIKKSTGEKIITIMGKNASHVSEKAYDAGYCRIKYQWVYR
jgi:hypothetical protein